LRANQYEPVIVIIGAVQDVMVDYNENIHQNSVVLTNSANIQASVEARLMALPPGHPDRKYLQDLRRWAIAIQNAEREEDFRHKELVAKLKECFPPLINILRALSGLAPSVADLLPKLNALHRQVEVA
jgi:hypothetical protein